jgi:hypothetical protein
MAQPSAHTSGQLLSLANDGFAAARTFNPDPIYKGEAGAHRRLLPAQGDFGDAHVPFGHMDTVALEVAEALIETALHVDILQVVP